MAAVNTGTGLAFSGEIWWRQRGVGGWGDQGKRVQLLVCRAEDEPTRVLFGNDPGVISGTISGVCLCVGVGVWGGDADCQPA